MKMETNFFGNLEFEKLDLRRMRIIF